MCVCVCVCVYVPSALRVFFFMDTSSASSSTRFMYSSKPCVAAWAPFKFSDTYTRGSMLQSRHGTLGWDPMQSAGD